MFIRFQFVLLLSFMIFDYVISADGKNREVSPVESLEVVKDQGGHFGDGLMMMDGTENPTMVENPTIYERCSVNWTCNHTWCKSCAIFLFDHRAKITRYLKGNCGPCSEGFWCKYEYLDKLRCALVAECSPQEMEPENTTITDRERHPNAYLIPRSELLQDAEAGRLRHCELYYSRHGVKLPEN